MFHRGRCAKCRRCVRAKRRYGKDVSKFLGFLLGIAVALVGPAVFGVLAADGGIELNAKEMALAYGIGALIFWTVLSYFSGAAALGAALTFGAMIYAVNWIPNRTTNFLNDVPGVTSGMIDGIKQYTLNGVVPILAVISLVYGIQLIVQAVQARRRERAEADLRQREQELAQAQQAAEAAAVYPVAGGDYPTSVDNRMGSSFSGNTSYDDLFDEEQPTPFPPRDQAEEQTTQYAVAEPEPARDDDTVVADAEGNSDDETMLVPTDKDETVVVPAQEQTAEESASSQAADEPPAEPAPASEQTPEEQARAEQGADEQAAGGRSAGAEAEAAAPAAEEASPTGGRPADEPAPGGPTAGGAVGGPTAGGGTAGGQTAGAPTASGAAGGPTAGGVAGGHAVGGSTAGGVGAGGPGAEDETVVAPRPGSASEVTPAEAPSAGPEKERKLERNEQVGQQYRERMDGPELEETSEFHFDAFENPNQPEEGRPQAPRIMDLPGQFRPAGA